MEKQIKARIQRGIKWLNKNHKGWYKTFGIKKFRIVNPYVCICGQVFEDMVSDGYGPYSGYKYFTNKYSGRFAIKLGFETPASGLTRYTNVLQAEWVKQLKILKKK